MSVAGSKRKRAFHGLRHMNLVRPLLVCNKESVMLKRVQKGVYDHLPRIAKKSFEIAAKDVVTRDWCLVHWSTHRAINKRLGLWTGSSKKAKFDWNEDL